MLQTILLRQIKISSPFLILIIEVKVQGEIQNSKYPFTENTATNEKRKKEEPINIALFERRLLD